MGRRFKPGSECAQEKTTLTPSEELQLQQLLQAKMWALEEGSPYDSVSGSAQSHAAVPEEWSLLRGMTLHSWQQDCVDAWFKNGNRGVVKVVTGAGKTILAMAIMERLQRNVDPDLRVAIVVPTIVLMDQWQEEFASRSNLPSDAIHLMGGGADEGFTDSTRVLICVLNSAAKKLANTVDKSRVSDHLLLVLDECHRYDTPQNLDQAL
jgi:superfamily II DNA or RNA helicase